MAEPQDLESSAELEALRRRVYGPDATDEDRRAYAAVIAAPAPSSADTSDGPTPDAPRPEPRHRLRRPVLIGAAGVAAVVALTAVATSIARNDGPSPATTSSAPSIWLGAAKPTAAPFPTPVGLSPTSGVVDAQQIAASGSATVPLLLDAAPHDGGRLMVLLSSSDPSPVGWVAQRPRAGSHSSGALESIATDPPALRQGTMAPTALPYSGAPPTQIVVHAPQGTGWTLTVAFVE